MVVPPFTVVLGVDQHCLKYLQITIPSWRAAYPELWRRPWVVFYDQVSVHDVRKVVDNHRLTCVPWNGAAGGYETQREKMLSGHVYISRFIETAYFLKIDCDAIAMRRTEWPKPEWFEDDPVLVGPSWHYWRAKGNKMTLVEWVRTLEDFGDRHFKTKRAGWEQRIGSWDHHKGPKLSDKGRFVSWLAFQRTDWVVKMSKLFEQDYGEGRLPVPSHDTSLWAAAVRSESLTRMVRVKPHWINRVSMKGCRAAIDELGLKGGR